MTTELISTLNPIAFVPHHSAELDELRVMLASNPVESEMQVLSSIDEKLIRENPLQVLSISIALVEANNWPHASQAIALYLQHYPGDENAIALLAFSLASAKDFEQAQIILNRAFSFLSERQESSSAHSEQAQLLEKKMHTFKLLEELIFNKESPADHVFSDKATLQLPLPSLKGPTQSQDLSEHHYDILEEASEFASHEFGLNDRTFRDVKVQDYLQRIDQLAELEARQKAQQSSSQTDQEAPYQETIKTNNLESLHAIDLEASQNIQQEDGSGSEFIAESSDTELSNARGYDTQVHILSSQDDNLIEDQMTEILRDAEAREQDTEHAYYPSTLVFDSASQFDSGDYESTLSVHKSRAKQDTGFISQIEYLSDYSELVDPSSIDLSSVDEISSGFVQSSISQVDSSNLTFDSTERMKSLSNTMMEEERQRIEYILNQNHLNQQSQALKTDDALVVPTPAETPYNSQSSQLKDPLLYPETLAPSLNSSPKNPSHASVPQVSSKAPPPLNGEHLGTSAVPSSGQLKAESEATSLPAESPFRRAKAPLPPIPTARHKKQNPQPDNHFAPNNENKQVPTRELPAAPGRSSLPPKPASPHYSPTVTKGQKSPLERLNAGELNVPYAPPLSSSSPQVNYQQAPPAKRTATPAQAPYTRSKEQKPAWGLWLMIALASYFSLMSAFHYKSEHLLHQTQLAIPLMEGQKYQDLQVQLAQTLSHPIGKSIDWLSIALPDSELNQKRQKIIHQYAWITTSRWVLFGEDSEKDEALSAIRLALSKSPNLDEGRAALGLAFIAFNQLEVAQAILQALPQKSAYKNTVLTRLYLQSDQYDKAENSAQAELRVQPLNTWLTDQVIYLQALAKKPPVSQEYQRLSLDQDLKDLLYTSYSVPRHQVIVSPKLSAYLKQQVPQKQRGLINLLLTELIKRRDRIGLQTLAQDLSLSSSSPSILLLPALSLALLELNFEDAEPIYRLINKRNQAGLLSNNDAAKARVLWGLFTGHAIQSHEQSFSFNTPKAAVELGHFSGPQVSKLISNENPINDSLKHQLGALSYLYHSQWPSLERVSESLAPEARKVFQKLAQSYLSHSYQVANNAFEALESTTIDYLNGIFTQNVIMHGVILSAFDQSGQAAYHFQKHAQTEVLPALKWLSQAWHCHLLSESSQLGLLRNVCSAAISLNPKDYRSTQTLAYTWLEVGRLNQAQITMNKVPTSELSPRGNELYLRLNFTSLSKPSSPKTNPDYIELLSAEKGLRLGSFLSFVEQQANRLSRHELYRATWVAKYLGSNPQLFSQLLQSAIKRGSLLARLEHARQSLFLSNSLGSPKSSLTESTRIEANAESETATFISLHDTLKCLAENKSLDTHHYRTAMNQRDQQTKLTQAIKTRVPPQPCRSLISESLSSFKNLSSARLPLVKLSFTQLLISLGYEERAEVILKDLIQQEPTLIEARVAYALLLLRTSKSPNLEELKSSISAIEDELYQARGLQTLHNKLREYGVVK